MAHTFSHRVATSVPPSGPRRGVRYFQIGIRVVQLDDGSFAADATFARRKGRDQESLFPERTERRRIEGCPGATASLALDALAASWTAQCEDQGERDVFESVLAYVRYEAAIVAAARHPKLPERIRQRIDLLRRTVLHSADRLEVRRALDLLGNLEDEACHPHNLATDLMQEDPAELGYDEAKVYDWQAELAKSGINFYHTRIHDAYREALGEAVAEHVVKLVPEIRLILDELETSTWVRRQTAPRVRKPKDAATDAPKKRKRKRTKGKRSRA